MQKRITMKISKGDSLYLQEIIEKGKPYQLKGFDRLDDSKKAIILAKTFLKKMFSYENRSFRVEVEGDKVMLKENVIISVKGMVKSKDTLEERKERITVVTNPVILEGLKVEGESLSFTIKFNPDSTKKDVILGMIPNKHLKAFERMFVTKETYTIVTHLKSFETWEAIILDGQKRLLKKGFEEKLLSMFFETLNENHLTKMTGNDAVNMVHIYKNANKYYTDFEALSFDEKLEVLEKGFVKARKTSRDRRDIHTIAMNVFEVLVSENLINEFKEYDYTYCKMRKYEFVRMYSSDGLMRHALFIEKDSGLKTGKLAFDLWHALTLNREKDETAAA